MKTTPRSSRSERRRAMLVLCLRCDREYFLNDVHRCQMSDAITDALYGTTEVATGLHRANASTSIFVGGHAQARAVRHGDPRFYKLLDEIGELHSRKSYDYTPEGDPLANFKRSEKMGVPAWKSCLIRMGDKFGRLEQLASGKDAKNESMRDTLIDLAVYSLLCVVLRDENERV